MVELPKQLRQLLFWIPLQVLQVLWQARQSKVREVM